jgi:hypothetical protein
MGVQHLNHHHARVLEEILEHRGRNIEWPDVVSLIQHIGSALQRPDGKYEFRIGTAEAVFQKPPGKDVTVDELVELRRFLKQAGVDPKSTSRQSQQFAVSETRAVVVLIDHYRARFFEPESASGHYRESEHFEAKDTEDLKRQLKEGRYEGERAPEAIDYYEHIAQHLKDAHSIVLAGDGTGKSSAMLDFIEFLKERHGDVASRIIATRDADLSSITLPDIEAIAARYNTGAVDPRMP